MKSTNGMDDTCGLNDLIRSMDGLSRDKALLGAVVNTLDLFTNGTCPKVIAEGGSLLSHVDLSETIHVGSAVCGFLKQDGRDIEKLLQGHACASKLFDMRCVWIEETGDGALNTTNANRRLHSLLTIRAYMTVVVSKSKVASTNIPTTSISLSASTIAKVLLAPPEGKCFFLIC